MHLFLSGDKFYVIFFLFFLKSCCIQATLARVSIAVGCSRGHVDAALVLALSAQTQLSRVIGPYSAPSDTPPAPLTLLLYTCISTELLAYCICVSVCVCVETASAYVILHMVDFHITLTHTNTHTFTQYMDAVCIPPGHVGHVPVHIGDLVHLGVTKSTVQYCCFHFL